MKRVLALFFPGLIFGTGLAVAGMTNPARVLGFLDPMGAWDPTLAFVMGGAVVAFAIGSRLVSRRPAPVLGESFPGKPSHAIDLRLVAGAAIFGVGWGLAGFCPGPAVTALGGLHLEAVVFVPAMLVGMIVAQRGLGADR